MKKKILTLLVMLAMIITMLPMTQAQAAVKLSKTKATMEVDSTLTLKISGTKSKATWKSSDKSIAKISSKGKVTAIKEGTANITATVDKKKYVCAVTVVDNNKDQASEKGYSASITYDNLSRTPDKYKGKKVKLSGNVLQTLEDEESESVELRLATKGTYDDVVYCAYYSSIIDFRLLEDDKIIIYGTAQGLISYKAVSGTTITLPLIYIDKIEMQGSGEIVDAAENTGGFDADAVSKKIKVKSEYFWQDDNDSYIAIVIKNNSEYTVAPQIKVKLYDADGSIIGYKEKDENAFGAGSEMAFVFWMYGDEEVASYEYEITVEEEKYYSEVVSDLELETSITKSKAIISVTNNGSKSAEFVAATIIYFKDGKPVATEENYCVDNDSEIKPGNSEFIEDEPYKEFDSIEVYLTGRGKK